MVRVKTIKSLISVSTYIYLWALAATDRDSKGGGGSFSSHSVNGFGGLAFSTFHGAEM